MVFNLVNRAKVAVKAIAVSVDNIVSNSADNDPSNLAEEDFDHLPLRALMSMLVHWTYFRDLKKWEKILAWVADYSNQRAEDYAKELWIPYHREEDLEELGLAFLRPRYSHRNRNAPGLAILLRGTIPTDPSDLLADLRIGLQELNQSHRVLRTVRLIVQVVEKFRKENPDEQICMAGHSLGAAIALIVGGTLYATYGIDINTHLFNPPLVTVVEVLTEGALPAVDFKGDDHVAELKVNFAKLKQVFVDAFAENQAIDDEWKQFQKLQEWVPHFYLNPGDLFCYRYINFYKGRRADQSLETARDLISWQGLLSSLFSRDAKNFKGVVPSADLHISNWQTGDPRLAHSLRQWHKYKPEFIRLEEVHSVGLSLEQRSRIRDRRFYKYYITDQRVGTT